MLYEEFIKSKIKGLTDSGFDIEENYLNPMLKPFQKWCVRVALKKGRYAFFEDCGLGKTFQQLEWAKHVLIETGKSVLILAPLAVSSQTIQEGVKFGIPVYKFNDVDYINNAYIVIANYEQLDNIDCSSFAGVALDESSILKNYEGSIRNQLIESFKDTPYKLCCTATPSPNDPMELGNHSEFLNVMSRNEMLSMYFVHDGGETAKWRLKGHSVDRFWQWVSTWAVMLSKPSDIGYDNNGYELPPLNYVEHQITTGKRDNGLLFNDVAISATNFNSELRQTKEARLNKAAEIVNSSKEQFIVWIKQNEEGEYLKKLIPGAIEVKGSDTVEYKEKYLLGFANNEFRVLITKAKIAQFGLNYQNCHNQVFASLDFSFEGLYQSIRRSYRFGQTKKVNIHLISTDTMRNVIASIKHKQKQFEEMQNQMQRNMNESFALEMKRALNGFYEGQQIKTDAYWLMRGDCVERTKEIESNSIHFSIFSPPFAELYVYSDSLEDMGNSKNYREFLKHFSFFIPELYRIMMPGRNIAVHCMPLPVQKGKEGYIGLRDFPGMIIRAFEKRGFILHDEIAIWKDPVVEMQRTKALGLLHKQVKKDSSMSRTGIHDKLLVFRKPGVNTEPITNTGIPVDLWQKYASPVWYDINYSNTLNLKGAREDKDEKHICPLQLDTVERAVHLWSNKGDRVFTPFLGIGSEVYQSVLMGRYGIGIELKQSYFKQAVRNSKDAALKKDVPELFEAV